MTTLTDGTYTETAPDGSDEAVQALTAAGGDTPLHPPKSWFQRPDVDRPTPITITADGKLFGHIAPWSAEHTGIPGQGVPRSASNYAFFRTGVVATAEGEDVPVGQITLAGGHCNDLTASAGKAVQHYDDTSSAVADVNIGEDMHGIWVAGAVRPGTTPDQIRALRASAPSGDWRPINGNHELIAICQVNHPGFPVARTVVSGGQMQAIVAAGASAMYAIRQRDAVLAAVNDMDGRLTRLEDRMAGQEATKVVEKNPLGNGEIAIPASGAGIVFNVNTSPHSAE